MDYNNTNYNHTDDNDTYSKKHNLLGGGNYTDGNCDEFFDIWLGLMVAGLLVIFALSALSNGLLIYIIAHLEKTKRALNLFFLCLAFFDLLFTLTLLFLAVEFLRHFDWVLGEASCKIIKGAFFTGQSGGLLLLTAMTLDRFCTAVLKARPLTQTVSLARVLCVTVWIFSIAASMRYLLLSENYEYYSLYLPSGGLGYVMEVLFLFLIPLAIIVFCYRCILRTVLSMPHTRGRKRKLVLLFCHIAAFIVCFVPYNVLVCYKRFYGMSGCDTKYEMLYLTSYILARSYCAVNPVFYLLRSSVRTAVYQHVCCLKPASHLSGSSTNSNDNTAHSNDYTVHALQSDP